MCKCNVICKRRNCDTTKISQFSSVFFDSEPCGSFTMDQISGITYRRIIKNKNFIPILFFSLFQILPFHIELHEHVNRIQPKFNSLLFALSCEHMANVLSIGFKICGERLDDGEMFWRLLPTGSLHTIFRVVNASFSFRSLKSRSKTPERLFIAAVFGQFHNKLHLSQNCTIAHAPFSWDVLFFSVSFNPNHFEIKAQNSNGIRNEA